MNKREKAIKKKYGMRPSGGTPIDSPPELGYRCPLGHSNLDFSEFKEHIWCYICKKDYHYADECVLVKDKWNPKDLPKQPKIITGIKNWDKTGNFILDIPKKLLRC